MQLQHLHIANNQVLLKKRNYGWNITSQSRVSLTEPSSCTWCRTQGIMW